MRSARSFSFLMPAKTLLVPGMCWSPSQDREPSSIAPDYLQTASACGSINIPGSLPECRRRWGGSCTPLGSPHFCQVAPQAPSSPTDPFQCRCRLTEAGDRCLVLVTRTITSNPRCHPIFPKSQGRMSPSGGRDG